MPLPPWDVHPNALPHGLAIVTDIEGTVDVDQLFAVLLFLLEDRVASAMKSGSISRTVDGAMWTELSAAQEWLDWTTPSALEARRRH